eukprot:m.202282 g.202282  ORF g.202282 m.202282 type:complete len:681 (+) comp21720_c0_seq1:202-2244(+)
MAMPLLALAATVQSSGIGDVPTTRHADQVDTQRMGARGMHVGNVTTSCAAPMNHTALGGRNMRASYLDPTHNISRCCATCDATPYCVAWTVNYVDNHCFLKAAIDKPPYNTSAWDVTSGIHPGVTPGPAPGPSGGGSEPPLPPAPPFPTTPCTGRCPNILWIIADDMRPQLGCYGHTFMDTPNIDALAASGTLFNRAVVQYAFCAPSRNSFMSGRRPDRTRVWNFLQNIRTNGRGPDWTTLPENFRRNGYLVLGTGKTFHPGDPFQFDYPRSWSFDEAPYTFGKLNDTGHSNWHNTTSDKLWCDNVSVVCADGEDGCPSNAMVDGEPDMWCSLNVSALGGRKLWDQEEAAFAKAHLQRARAMQRTMEEHGQTPRPFFLATGFHRPHLPWIAPSEFYDLYPPADQLPGPTHPNVPDGMPPVAWHQSFGNAINRPLPSNRTLLARRGLYATMSYVDSLVGEVLTELDQLGLTQNTAVILMGDHGQSVGEQNLWMKMTNFELGVRIPLIIRAPWIPGSSGRRSNVLAEAIDMYRTMADLAGIPVPTNESHAVQGESLVPALSGGTKLSNYSFSQFAKDGPDNAPFDTCMSCTPTSTQFMGFSVRSASWRYTEWYRWNNTKAEPAWDELFASELYDHRNDLGNDFDAFENVNLVANGTGPPESAVAMAVAELKPVLQAQFQTDE